jgi:hypothetical protein
VLLRQVAIDPDRAHLVDPEPLRLQAAQDLADQAAANRIWLDDEQRRLFGHDLIRWR